MVPSVTKSRNQPWLPKGKKKKQIVGEDTGYTITAKSQWSQESFRVAPNGTRVSLPNSTSPREVPVMWFICRPIYREWSYWDGISVFYCHAKSYHKHSSLKECSLGQRSRYGFTGSSTQGLTRLKSRCWPVWILVCRLSGQISFKLALRLLAVFNFCGRRTEVLFSCWLSAGGCSHLLETTLMSLLKANRWISLQSAVMESSIM